MNNKITNQYLDSLKINENKKIMKNLQQQEIILISSKVIKINHVNKRQERVLAISNLNAINIAAPSSILPNRIKRKIPLQRIIGITTSRFGNQIVIHVDKEDDYRFFTPNLKTKYVEILVIAIFQYTKKPVKLYYYDDLSLEQYTTTIIDVQKKWRKPHKCEPVFMDDQKITKNDVSKSQSKLIFSGRNDEGVQNFQQFDIIKVLGRGAFGKVMLCKNKNNGQYYAVKSMRKQDLVDKQSLQRTKNQRYLLEKADHPFLVNLQYAFQSKQKIFLVMKFFRGGEMFSRIRKQKAFSEQRTKFYSAQVFLALEQIHKMGFIYRDLKPQNILFDTNGYIRVSDYGLSKCIKQGERTHSITGTPSYLSPEIIKKQGHSYQVDWWTLGVLIYEMLFSIPPFYNKDHRTMFTAIAFHDFRFPQIPSVSQQCKSIITGLLCKDQTKRLGSNDVNQIRNHPWFKDMDWQALIAMKMIPEYIPEVISDIDVSNFLDTFTKEEPIDTLLNTDDAVLDKIQKQFEGFNYQKMNNLQFNNKRASYNPESQGDTTSSVANSSIFSFKKK